MKKLMMFVLVIALSAVSALGAISSATWSVKASGSNNNGGAYFGSSADYSKTIGPKWALTAVTTAGADAVLLSASASSDMVGSCANIVSGTNFTAGRYEIISVVASTSITLDRTCTTGAGADGVVNIGGALSTIAAAITAAAAGDTIIVSPGTYDEAFITIATSNLKIYGAGATIIRDDGDDTGVVLISGSNVVFDGFTITNTGNSSNDYGISITGKYNTINNVTVTAGNGTSANVGAHSITITGSYNKILRSAFTNASSNITLGGAAACRLATGVGNFFDNCFFTSSTPASIYDTAGNSIYTNCYVTTSATLSAITYAGYFSDGTILDKNIFYVNSATTDAARTALYLAGYCTVINNTVYCATSGSDTGNAVGIYISSDGAIIDRTTVKTSATGGGTAYDLSVATTKTCIVSASYIATDKILLTGTGAVKYAPVNVLQSGGAAPIAITDILKAGSSPIWTDSYGRAKTTGSGVYGN